jgi:hypothetical protein
MDPLFFYWLIAAVVATPIVAIVRGITAGKNHKSGGTADPDRGNDPR